MKLRVLLFASLRERAGIGELDLDGLPDTLTLRELKLFLQSSHPSWGPLEHVSGVVGEQYVPDSTCLQDGQEVALLPPVSGGEESPMTTSLVDGVFELASEPIDIEALRLRVEDDRCGAVVLFSGNVRMSNRGEDVRGIDYEAFEKLAHPEMARIFERCRSQFGDASGDQPEKLLRMLCVHRVGHVAVGECSVLIAVASPHRDAAFMGARFLIDELKASLPVWKKELYSDGHHWIGDRS
jgi:molybdopterin synthase catalytic subunit/molybdopterin converting factor small subunit